MYDSNSISSHRNDQSVSKQLSVRKVDALVYSYYIDSGFAKILDPNASKKEASDMKTFLNTKCQVIYRATNARDVL